ncbi:MAG: F0F1 ATP synthase subunit epsilon [bacterium]
MIPQKINLEILTPEAKVYAAEVSSVSAPGVQGYFGVYPGHTPFVTALRIGEIKIDVDGKVVRFAASGGVAEVLPHHISLLVETCEHAGEIDVKRAESARDRARGRIEKGRQSWDVARAEIALARAINRIKIATK